MRRIIHKVLTLASKLYGWGQKMALSYYRNNPGRVHKVGARVISIGNITWGGTGKTPLVIMLAKALAGKGKRVAVLTRGYGQDEVHELQNHLAGVPVLVGADRVKNAQKAVRENQVEMIILDDGFQHYRLHRSCDVVSVNATNAFGNGFLIPRGCLREPVENLARADVFVLTNASLGTHNLTLLRQKLREINPRAAIYEADHQPVRLVDVMDNKVLDLSAAKGKKTATLAGIEDPASFERTIEELGVNLVYAARFDDHHDFTPAELTEVFKAYRELGAEMLVTTSKDYYRLGRVLDRVDRKGIRFFVLQIEIQMDDEEGFIRRCGNL